MSVYRGMTQEQLDREYSPSSRAPDFVRTLEQYRERSDRARRAMQCRLDMPYGSTAVERLDFFPPTRADAPLHVFVHGGHWQQSSKEDSAFAAPALVAAGAGFAALGYGLAPGRRLDQMVNSVRRGLHWLRANAAALGCRPDTLYASGSSAGAHLIAMAISATGSAAPAQLDGVCLLSGVYDLEPVRLSYVNDAMGMDARTARALSPLHHLPLRSPRVIVARGAAETREYARQHDDLVRGLRAAGRPPVALIAADRHHFDLPLDLGDPGTGLGRVVLDQLRQR